MVVDHQRGHVVWARPGKNADMLKASFDELDPERCAKLEAVTIGMSGHIHYLHYQTINNELRIANTYHAVFRRQWSKSRRDRVQ